MQQPLDITFKDVAHSDAVEQKIRERAADLEKYFDRIVSCRVVVTKVTAGPAKGNVFQILVRLGVPGSEITVDRSKANSHAHADIYIAIRDAFDAATRQLKEYAEKLRGDVKIHDAPPPGVIVRIFKDQGYGFVQILGGQEIYFHKDVVTNGGFERLEVGSEVRIQIAPAEGPMGPQATSVQPALRV